MNQHDEKIMFGFWVYLMSDCVLFAGLFAVYAVLHTATLGAGTPEQLFSLPFVLAETLILLTSSVAAGLATIAAHRGSKTWTFSALAVTFALGLGFLGMELSEFSRLIQSGFGPSQSAFLSSFFTLVGTHGLHVALGSVWMLALAAHIYKKGLTPDTTRKLALWSLFWHFLDIIWICIFTIVYLWSVL